MNAISRTAATISVIVIIIIAAFAGYYAFYSQPAPTPQATSTAAPQVTSAATAQAKFTIAFSQIGDPTQGGLWRFAQDQGFFSKYVPSASVQGLRTGTGGLMSVMASGTVDVGVAETTGAITGIASGAPVKIVAVFMATPAVFVVAVNQNSTYKSLSDLKGKTFAVTEKGSFSYVGALVVFSQHNFTDYHFTSVSSIPAQVAAVLSGAADATTLPTSALVVPLDTGKLRAVVSQPLEWPLHFVVARTDFLKAHPDLVKATLNALQSAAAQFNTNQNAATSLLQNQYKYTVAEAQNVWNTYKFSTDGTIPASQLQVALNALVKTGSIKSINISDLYATGFAPIK